MWWSAGSLPPTTVQGTVFVRLKVILEDVFATPTYAGEHCDTFAGTTYPGGCSGLGVCQLDGSCACHAGSSGDDCSILTDACNGCGHGHCESARCVVSLRPNRNKSFFVLFLFWVTVRCVLLAMSSRFWTNWASMFIWTHYLHEINLSQLENNKQNNKQTRYQAFGLDWGQFPANSNHFSRSNITRTIAALSWRGRSLCRASCNCCNLARFLAIWRLHGMNGMNEWDAVVADSSCRCSTQSLPVVTRFTWRLLTQAMIVTSCPLQHKSTVHVGRSV